MGPLNTGIVPVLNISHWHEHIVYLIPNRSRQTDCFVWVWRIYMILFFGIFVPKITNEDFRCGCWRWKPHHLWSAGQELWFVKGLWTPHHSQWSFWNVSAVRRRDHDHWLDGCSISLVTASKKTCEFWVLPKTRVIFSPTSKPTKGD